MGSPNEIQIFVSNPKDVNPEKKIVENVCNRINSQLATIDCNVRYLVKEWGKLIGKFGGKPQMEIESLIGAYDVYLGIWWNKFGSDTGIINPDTNNDYGSGTYREFCLAYNNWNINKIPEIYLFFKKEPTEDIYNPAIHAEIGKVIDFEKSQQLNGFCNPFDNERDFERKITDILYTKATQICMGFKIEEKQLILNDNIKLEIRNSQTEVREIPKTYLLRTTSHFSSIKEKQKTPFLEIEKQSLEQLIITKKRIIFLGDAGSGKSTELENLFNKLNKKDSPLIPVFKNLNIYTPEQGIEDFLPKWWKKIPNNLLLIILDGLDEIQPKHFNTLVRQINTFSEKYKEIRLLISCRTNFYEFPLNNSTGTLPGFEPYLINDLNINDASEYYQKKYPRLNAKDFITEAFDVNIADLLTKPFFLMLLADYYDREQNLTLNRSNLYEMFLINRIELDQNHFKSTLDLRNSKKEIIKLLQKVALSMEILSKNQINETDLLDLFTNVEFTSLKYCTAFKKKDGEDNIWQFEHNNIQEFLAAKALSVLEFDRVIKFIAFKPDCKKLIPSWLNTLSFLFSVLDKEDELFKNLIEWILTNEKEVIVKFEPDKVDEDLRIDLFKSIFNYYKKHDIWISSNKFSDEELARFGQSEDIFKFLFNEIENNETTRIVKINAIRLLGHFELNDNKIKCKVESLLLKQIESNLSNTDYIHTIIYALKYANLNDRNTINNLMKIVGENNNQYVRSAMYSILSKSEALEDYVDYLIQGYELTKNQFSTRNEEINLLDEELNLKECVMRIKSPTAIKLMIAYVSNSNRFDIGYDPDTVLKSLIENAAQAYNKDYTVYDTIFNWFLKDVKNFSTDKLDLHLSFFDATNTREKAFHQIWLTKEDNERNKSLAIAKLLSQDLISFVIQEYQNRNITNKELESMYYDLNWTNNNVKDDFEKLINEKTNFKIKKPEYIDYEGIRKKKTLEDFNLLFDRIAFKNETLRVFEGQKKEVLSFDELFETSKKNNRYIDIEDYYSDVALRLLRDFITQGQTISKEKVVNWFEKEVGVEWYMVSLVYNYLSNYKEIEINDKQKKIIIKWCYENINKVNFKTALKVKDDGGITFNNMAIYIWYFSRKFDITYPKKILLDMLSFDSFQGGEWIGIDYLVCKLEHKDIVKRMINNIKVGIQENNVLKNHIKYLTKNKVEKSYPFILNEIVNINRTDYQRIEFLDVFFKNTKDTHSLKTILKKADLPLKWVIIDKLRANNEESFVEKYLLKEIKKDIDVAEKGKAACVLVMLQNLEGLKEYVNWVKNKDDSEIDTSRVSCLNSLKSKEAIPYLLELLKLSYLKEIKVDRFDRFNSNVLGAFFNIGLVSEENLKAVKENLENFIKKYSSKYNNVKYILHTIEQIEERFYMNRVQSFTIKEVKEKLLILNE